MPSAPTASSLSVTSCKLTSAMDWRCCEACLQPWYLPRTTAQLQAVVKVCARHQIPFVGRGAGTGLSGGALPDDRGIVISFARMTRVLASDVPNQRITVEAGVINAHVTQRVAAAGYFYAPDPSSQTVCTIGGNVAENSGGAHCLKYGFTTTHVLELEVVFTERGSGAFGIGHAGCSRLRSGWRVRGVGRDVWVWPAR